MIKIVSYNGDSPESEIQRILKNVVSQLKRTAGKTIADSMTSTVRRHIAKKYPGSQHWNQSKVNVGQIAGTSGETVVDIPGAGRAYHDVTIRPLTAKHLTIPMHSSAYGKKTSDFNDLFKPKGKNALARIDSSGQLVWMFALADSAFQRKDPTLMPSDQTLADNIFNALIQKI